MPEEYSEGYYSKFDVYFKKVLKKYRRIDSDFARLKKVIFGKLVFFNNDASRIPFAVRIAGLGDEVKLPIFKMDMFVEECRKNNGRVIFLFDSKSKKVVFIDIYVKNSKENHDEAVIKDSYNEYINLKQ